MKKVYLFLAVLLLGVLVSGCSDKKYTDDAVNVIFYTDSGATKIPTLLNVEPGSLIEKPEDPVRPGYVFGGWYKDIDYKEEWDFETDRVEKSIVLWAKWIKGVYKIEYVLNGGVMPNDNYPTTYETGDTFTLPIPTRTGYEFLGWYLFEWEEGKPSTKPGEKRYVTFPKDAYGDITFHAHWKVISVNVSFNLNLPEGVDAGGLTAPKPITMEYGSTIDFDQFPDIDGYRFVGWNSRRDGTGDWFVNGTAFTRTQRTTVYAIWTPINQ